MKFLLYLPHGGRSGPARIGQYSRNHEHDGKLLYKGQPLEVDPFDPCSVAAFNATVRKEIELGFRLGIKVYAVPPCLELLVVPDPIEAAPPAVEEAQVPRPRKAGRPPAVAFPPHPELEPLPV